MDTGTVRLVIFLGMILVFASEYSTLISTIFGSNSDQNTVLKRLKGPPEKNSDVEYTAAAKVVLKEDNGKKNL